MFDSWPGLSDEELDAAELAKRTDMGKPSVTLDESVGATIQDWQWSRTREGKMHVHDTAQSLLHDANPMRKVELIRRSAEEFLSQNAAAHPYWIMDVVLPPDRRGSQGRGSLPSWILAGFFRLTRVDHKGSEYVKISPVPRAGHSLGLDGPPTLADKQSLAVDVDIHGKAESSQKNLWQHVTTDIRKEPLLDKKQTIKTERREYVQRVVYALHWQAPSAWTAGDVIQELEALKMDSTMVHQVPDQRGTAGGRTAWSHYEIRVQWDSIRLEG